ncbi:methyltransferase domain-containing protein [Actinomadura logoneensis]|uniref:Protein-L-isoaspartate O-methyltransferase n=1 Tax=Actinomadura logoneensis TaxID=2293572 RepID=A0A372JLM5_9ACTN|nr:methyltransferase domain-containing protein [Actinomadura logoneensis]RFU40839.1 methyltransferase domain-containing protein [Actinomadura logoneensis]
MDFGGVKVPEAWAEAAHAVPRERFIPAVALVGALPDDPASWIDRDLDPAGWLRAVYSDVAIGVQLNDGALDIKDKPGDPFAVATSSCSAPSLVFAMLELLAPAKGDVVLEIGTGTGWTAGLLASLLGENGVVSVEIDPAIAAQARANLQSVGLMPSVIVGDGALGHPERAPYDRVHVTCGVTRIPYEWVGQSKAGGVIVLPWTPGWQTGHIVRLTVNDGIATGRFHGPSGFMPLRSQRPPEDPISGEPRESVSTLDPHDLASAPEGLSLAVAGLLPDVRGHAVTNADGTLRVAARQGDSHALAIFPGDASRAEVVQRGPRDLWDELEAAVHQWNAWNRPTPDRFGLTVTPEGQHVWLD